MDELAAMGEGEILDLAAARAVRIREDEVDLLKLAYQWAVVHDPARLDPEESAKPGREKAKRYGGDGTPQVCEFAAAELGARIGASTFAAEKLMADSLDLHHRGGRLWDRVVAGEVKVSYARHVVARTRSLDSDQATAVANRVAQSADGRIPWSRFEKQVEAEIAKADPDAARDKELKAQEATFARQLRTDAHGMASYLTRAPVWMIAQIAAVVKSYSAAISDDFPELTDDERDALAHLMLLTPGADQDTGRLAEHRTGGDPLRPHLRQPRPTCPVRASRARGTRPRDRGLGPPAPRPATAASRSTP